jgi:hypothetical protein
MYPLGTWFVSGICVWIPCIKETMMMMMMIIIIIIIIMIIYKKTCRLSIGLFGIKKTCNSSENKLSFAPFLKRGNKSTRLENDLTK